MRYFNALILALACLWLSACSSLSEVKPPIQSTVLLQTTEAWDGTPYTAYPRGAPQLTLVKIIIPAHTVVDWHTHPIPNAGYMLGGELTVETRTGQKRLLKAGDALAEMVNVIHRGVTGAQAAELIVFYAGASAIPLSERAK